MTEPGFRPAVGGASASRPVQPGSPGASQQGGTEPPFCPDHGGPADDCEQCRDERETADDQATDEDWWTFDG